jgi:predicted peroxiredoxin
MRPAANPCHYTPPVGQYLVILAHSTEDPNRAASALWTALGLGEAGHRVDLWLHGEGVRLGVKHVAEALREPFAKSAAEMLEALAARGSALHCSKPCFTQRGFAETALRAGARLAEPAALAGLLAAGATPLTL